MQTKKCKIAFLGDDFSLDFEPSDKSYRIDVNAKFDKETKSFLGAVTAQCNDAPPMHNLEVELPISLFDKLFKLSQPTAKFGTYNEIKSVSFRWE